MLTKVDDRIWIIDTMALERPEVVAAYMIRGKESALIDMGYASSIQTVLKGIEESGISSEGIDYLLPTHVHLDHARVRTQEPQQVTSTQFQERGRHVPLLLQKPSPVRLFGCIPRANNT